MHRYISVSYTHLDVYKRQVGSIPTELIQRTEVSLINDQYFVCEYENVEDDRRMVESLVTESKRQ